ncbi:MAG: hypothetical protein PWR04_1530 [Anaerophaga sp.]|nr:hypothetical protein [Anaerophaga sp.]
MKVCYNNYPNGYPEIRNFIKPNEGKIEFRRCRDLFSLLLALVHKFTGKGYRPFLKGLFFNPFISEKKEFNFFNTILIGNNPYEVTFETTLPRLGNVSFFWYKMAVKQLAKPNCRSIFAMSQCAYNLQKEYMEKNHPRYATPILNKMKVRHPYQEPLIESYEAKMLPADKIVFTLTGADFFRKGGMEVLKAFDQLIPKHHQLQLNIISSLNFGDYATHTTIDDQIEAKRIIAKYPENITHYPSLPNNEVLEIYKQSHIGLLPTWADSYGYSVLEAQAAGCPCITTDIRALPEINNDEIGWVINLPLTKYSTDLQNLLINKIYQTIALICSHPKIAMFKGKKVLQLIIQKYEANIPSRQ